MKTVLIVLPLLCAAQFVLAQEPAPAQAAPQPEAAVAPMAAKSAPARKRQRAKTRRLPKGDLRNCLDLKDSKAVIACSEKGG